MSNNVFKLPPHVSRISAPPFFAIYPSYHFKVVRIFEFISGYQTRSHNVCGVKILAFGRSQHTAHFFRLHIPGRNVVEDRVPEDVFTGCVPRNVFPGLADIAAELQLKIQSFTKAGPLKMIVGADYRKPIAFVVNRLTIEYFDNAIIRARIHGFQCSFRIWSTERPGAPSSSKALTKVQFETRKIPHLRRRLNWCSEPNYRTTCNRINRSLLDERAGKILFGLARFGKRQNARERWEFSAPGQRVGPLTRGGELPALSSVLVQDL